MANVFNRNITGEAHEQLTALASKGIGCFAFTPSGGWVVITNRHTCFARNIPDECFQKILEFQRKREKIHCVAFPPRGGNRWSIITEKGFFNRNIPDECHQKMREFQNSGNRVRWVAFPPKGGNSWAVLAQRGFHARNIPDECYQIMRNIHQGQRRVHTVAFDPDRKGWVVVAKDYFFARDIDDELFTQLRKFNRNRWIIKTVAFDPDRRGWSLSANSKFRNRLSEPIRDYENKIGGKSIWQSMQEAKVPGVAVAAIINNRVAWSCGYGQLKKGEDHAVHPESIFQAASISKVLAALGVLRLERLRLIDIDDDVTDRLTSWTLGFNRGIGGTSTIRGLLSHSAGTNIGGFDGYRSDASVPSLVQVLSGQSPANSGRVRVTYTPGTSAAYSGGGFEVLQQMLEDVTDGNFNRWMKRQLFEPAGMNDTSFDLTPKRKFFSSQNVATAHDGNGRPISGERNSYPESAAAGAYTNVLDLARMIILINRGGLIGRTRLLSAAQITDLLTPQHPFPASGIRGLGVRVNRRNNRDGLNFNYLHGGSNRGFRAAFRGFPNRGTGVVVLTNGSNRQLRWTIANAVRDAYGWNRTT